MTFQSDANVIRQKLLIEVDNLNNWSLFQINFK